MKKNNRETGAKAEAIACWFLKQQGYDVLEQNFYTKVGEIDIIAKEDQTLVFVEVKYRKDGTTISFMRLYCSSSLHKKGYCIRKYKGIELQSVTQIVVANLNKKVNNLINCEDVTKLLEKSYKNRDVQGIKNELDLKQKKLAKINKIDNIFIF